MQSAPMLEVVEVTGSRIRGLLQGATAQPVLTLDSKDIERTGATSLGDLFRYIPQVSSFSTGQSITAPTVTRLVNASTGAVTTSSSVAAMNSAAGRTTASLRGTPADGTLLLVNGRRTPKNNQSAGGDSYDLNGIPVAAIERIEVLLDGASSIYGADAMGGVINVILKKHYRGTELRMGYDNTFDKDAGVLTTSLTHGFAAGKLSGLVTLSYETANTMALRDRAITASYDRTAYGGLDLRANIAGGAGRVSRTGTVPLPGLTTTVSAVPSGTTGTGLTITDYLNAGPIPANLDLAQYLNYSSTYERKSVIANIRYDFRDWLEVYGEFRASRNRNDNIAQPVSASLSVPAGYPGNPFGIAVTLSKYFVDLDSQRTALDDSIALVLGARGKLAHDWRYDVFINRVQGHTVSEGDNTALNLAIFNAAVAAGQRPNIFYDSTKVANPNAPGVLEALTVPIRDEERTETWSYQAQADGPVFDLPAGKVQVAVGAEYREDYTDFPLRLATDQNSARADNRDVTAYFAETNVPVFAPAQQIPLLNQLNLSASLREERYSLGGRTSNPRGGFAWRPVKFLLLRASYGQGFKVPTLLQRNAPTVIRTAGLGSTALDPLRGNTVVAGTVVQTSGGNPDLRPERSENTTAGVVFEVPQIKGLSFSVSYFDNKFIDRISSLTFTQIATFYPDRVTRGANLPTDQPGWAGPVTSVDLRNVNVSFSRVTGYDISAKYDATTPWGDVMVNVAGTKYTRNEFVTTPTSGPVPTFNLDSLPVQVSGSAFLARGAWGTGVLGSYRASGRLFTTIAATPSAIRWDWQFNYDFDKAPWAKARRDHWYGKALKGTKVSLTIFNVLDTDPPLDGNALPDNTVVDARLRRYALSFRKAF
ncbi:MAG: TonB-dependent receptor [Lacunisphaera sp.]|nr:TonB-dependent receptor [Lacunisphaera sp.]